MDTEPDSFEFRFPGGGGAFGTVVLDDATRQWRATIVAQRDPDIIYEYTSIESKPLVCLRCVEKWLSGGPTN
jgi:hypothetical protein